MAGKFAQWNQQFDTLTPLSLMINNTYLDKPGVTSAIRRFYFGSDTDTITPDMLQPITEVSQASVTGLSQREVYIPKTRNRNGIIEILGRQIFNYQPSEYYFIPTYTGGQIRRWIKAVNDN